MIDEEHPRAKLHVAESNPLRGRDRIEPAPELVLQQTRRSGASLQIDVRELSRHGGQRAEPRDASRHVRRQLRDQRQPLGLDGLRERAAFERRDHGGRLGRAIAGGDGARELARALRSRRGVGLTAPDRITLCSRWILRAARQQPAQRRGGLSQLGDELCVRRRLLRAERRRQDAQVARLRRVAGRTLIHAHLRRTPRLD